MKRLLSAIVLFLSLAIPARGQDIVTGLSLYDIELTPSFKGQDLFLYGAIKKGDLSPGGGFDIIVVLQGEERPHVVRKKERVFGFWLNTQSRTVRDVPEFYGQASTRPVDEIADPETLNRLGLGVSHQPFYKSARKRSDELGFVEGLIRYKQKAGLFQFGTTEMPVSSEILFRADFFFPPSVPSGTYKARAYLFKDGKLLGTSDKAIRVNQVGLERALYVLAHENPPLYGIMAILIALLAGWGAGYITRGRSKIG